MAFHEGPRGGTRLKWSIRIMVADKVNSVTQGELNRENNSCFGYAWFVEFDFHEPGVLWELRASFGSMLQGAACGL